MCNVLVCFLDCFLEGWVVSFFLIGVVQTSGQCMHPSLGQCSGSNLSYDLSTDLPLLLKFSL